MTSLSEILGSYRGKYKKKATGGLSAIRGFDFQVRCYLADLTEELVSLEEGPNLSLNSPHLHEAFSDYTRLADSDLVCVQVKLKWNSISAKAAAAEFCLLDEFFELQEYERKVTFEAITGGGGEISDWDSVKFDPGSVEADRWAKVLSENRVRPIRVEVDPWWRIISSVFQRVDDPFAFARKAFEETLSATSRNESSERIRDIIAEIYLKSRRKNLRLTKPISAEEFLPKESSDQRASFPVTPSIEHLNRGLFFERRKLLDDVENRLGIQMSLVEDGTLTNTCQVFWLHGASGCGKSVLMLQLLRRVARNWNKATVWVGRNVEEVFDLIEAEVEDESPYEDLKLFFVDDIYDPYSRDILDIRKMARRIEGSQRTSWPIIVTCGPTEFAQRFRNDCGGYGFDLTMCYVPTFDYGEKKEFVEWYSHRFTRPYVLSKKLDEYDNLAISLVDQLDEIDMRPFAIRFSDRLRAAGLEKTLRIPLALNRLYIGSPYGWFSDKEKTTLSAVSQDLDFELVSFELRQTSFRLTHAHISDAVYEALCVHNTSTSITLDIVAAFKKCVDSDLPTAFQLIRAIVDREKKLEQIDLILLAEGIAECVGRNLDLWERDLPAYASSIVAYISKWTLEEERVDNTFKGHGIIERAMRLNALTDEHWVQNWLILWENPESRALLAKESVKWLKLNRADPRWSTVWSRSLEEAEDDLNSLLLSIAWEWLDTNNTPSAKSFVLEHLVRLRRTFENSVISIEDLNRAVSDWLDENPSDKSWNYLWRTSFETSIAFNENEMSDSFAERGYCWLVDNEGNLGWPFVVQDLLKYSKMGYLKGKSSQLVETAIYWLKRNGDSLAAPFVAGSLLQTGDKKNKTLRSSIEFLQNQPDLKFWNMLWISSAYVAYFRPRLTEERVQLQYLGLQWMKENRESIYAHGVWHAISQLRKYLEEGPHDVDFIQVGYVLLRDVRNPRWPSVYLAMIQEFRRGGEISNFDASRAFRELARYLEVHENVDDNLSIELLKKTLSLPAEKITEEFFDIALPVVGAVSPDVRNYPYLLGRMLSFSRTSRVSLQILSHLHDWFDVQGRSTRGSGVWHKLKSQFEMISRTNVRVAAKMRTILNEYEPYSPESWSSVEEAQDSDTILKVQVKSTTRISRSRAQGGDRVGLVVSIDSGISGFLPLEELQSAAGVSHKSLIGSFLDVVVMRADSSRGQVDVSQKSALFKCELDLYLAVSPHLESRVTNVVDFGVFVSVGGIVGLIHSSRFVESGVPEWNSTLAIGDPILVKIEKLDVKSRRVSFSVFRSPPVVVQET